MKTTIAIEGTQHPTIPEKTGRLYKDLFNALPQSIDKAKLSKFFPIKGTNYKEAYPNIMLVGRCVNGWGKLSDETAEGFADSAAKEILSFDGFKWIDKDDHIGTYIEDGKTKEYNINASAFWRVAKNVVYKVKPWLQKYRNCGCVITNENIKTLDNENARWVEHIVWTNIFPIAPLKSGNTNEKIKRLTKDICAELLLEQIKLYKPTHIIFITDWDYWFSDISEKFPNVKKISGDKKDNIVGFGEIEGIKTVVTRRPETRSNKKMADDIFEKLF